VLLLERAKIGDDAMTYIARTVDVVWLRCGSGWRPLMKWTVPVVGGNCAVGL